MTLHILRGLFLLLMVAVGASVVLGDERRVPPIFLSYPWVPVTLAVILALLTIALDLIADRRKFSIFSGVAFGLTIGLVISYALSLIIGLLIENVLLPEQDDIEIAQTLTGYLSLLFGCLVCYLTVTFVLQTRDDFRFIIPYVEFRKNSRGAMPYVVDTSVLIDGRVSALASTGLFESALIVPQFVVVELQALADSADDQKRSKGRRGLEVLAGLKNQAGVDLRIYEPHTTADAAAAELPVDQRLLDLTRQLEAKALTLDYNLNRVSQVSDVPVLNLNDVTAALQLRVMPGDELRLEVTREGKGNNQGVAYLEDGTMVVVEEAGGQVGRSVRAVVTNTTQTSAGRMIFARFVAADPAPELAEPKPEGKRPGRRMRINLGNKS